jgi:cob(I)alamin adenosyltransferase
MTGTPQASSDRKGLVQVFTGDGRGKTSAALGTALRSLGHDFKVCIVHFMKGNFPYGEQKVLSRLPDVTLQIFGRLSFVDPNNPEAEDIEEARKALEASRAAVLSGDYDLVVLDEINVASAWGLVSVEDVVKLLKQKPGHVEVILTGRYADDRLIELADLVTEMRAVKHPFNQGIEARAGCEY